MIRSRLMLAVAGMAMLAMLTSPAPAAGEASAVEPYRAGDRSITALNILPPGQGGYMNAAALADSQRPGGPKPDHFTDQRQPYADLISEVGQVTAGNLGDYFKDASFGVKPDDIARQYSPRPGVDIIRDKSYNVPHVYGQTRSDTMFGAGYVSAEDRLFMMDVLRNTGRGRLTEFVGPSVSNFRLDCAQSRVGDYTEQELQAMIDQLPAGADQALAEQAKQDVIDYTAGINKYISEAMTDPSKMPGEYAALQLELKPWKVTDTVAVGALIGGSLGVGGGAELGNAEFMNALMAAGHSKSQARIIMNDLHFLDDPEAASSTDDPFPWNNDLGPIDPASVAIPDAGSYQREDEIVTDSCTDITSPLPSLLQGVGPLGPAGLQLPDVASNALLVGSKLSKSGNPIAVFGPQVGYWSPEILMELDLHGPGISARGVGFPGISLYVLLGRGDGYGYSATSASGDQVDIRAVKLCEPGALPPTKESDHYVRYDGQCVPIDMRSQSWTAKPSAGSCTPPQPKGCVAEQVTIRTERVELAGIPGSVGLRGGKYGLIEGRGTIDGAPVAFARQRVSYGGEVDSALTYVEMMNPATINSAADFQRAFSRFNFTFNWFYLDDKDIAYQLGGAHPLRAPGADPDLPVWDSTRWAWPGLLSFQGTPKDTNPAKGWITSWNNKQAPGFRAADDNWGFTSVDRVLPLNEGIEAADNDDGKVDMAELVRIMGDAATVDLRGAKVLPLMLDVIGDAGTDRLRTVMNLLRAWNGSGAHRLDADGDTEYEHQAAIAVMDEWWPKAVGAIFRPTFGPAFDNCWARPTDPQKPSCPLPYTIDDAVNSQYDQSPDQDGSSFNDGFYGQVQKDLRSLLGRSVQAPFSRRYCGGGDLSACRAALATSLDEAVTAVETRQGSPDPADWDAPEGQDQIFFSAVGVSGIPPIQWQNRPTFQQVLEFRPWPPGQKDDPTNEDGKKDSVAEQVAALVAQCLAPKPGLTQILGTEGPDVLYGTDGRDVICGYGARDRLIGLEGDDILIGGNGGDVLVGGPGRDRLVGEESADRLRGGKGRDVLYGGRARDRCSGGPGGDIDFGCERGKI